MRSLIFAAALVLLPIAALAQAASMPAHTVDMTTPLHDVDGKPLKDPAAHDPDDPTCAKCPPLTVGDVVARALFNVPGSDDPHAKADPQKLWARGALAMRIQKDKTAVLTAPEIAMIEELVGRGYPSPLLIMQVFPLLDPAAKPAADIK